MKNEELKKEFIQHKQLTSILDPYTFNTVFGKISFFEEILDKDCMDFTREECLDFFKSLNSNSTRAMSSLRSHYANYTRYCIQRSVVRDMQNHWAEVTASDLDGCVNQNRIIYIKETEIKEWVKQLPNYSDQVLLLGLYEGIKGFGYEELYGIKRENIQGNVLILSNNSEKTISSELSDYMIKALDTWSYISLTNPTITKKYNKNDFSVIKCRYNATLEKAEARFQSNIILQYNRIIEYLGLNVEIKDIFYSGLINFIKKNAKEKGISNIGYMRKYADEVRKQYGEQFNPYTTLRQHVSYLE